MAAVTAGGHPTKRRPLPSEFASTLNPRSFIRLAVTLSFPLLILLAVPFWWYTTSIERLPLPTARIAALEASSPPEVRTPILFTADPSAFPTPREGKARFESEVILGALATEVIKGVDGILGQQPATTRGKRLWDLVVRDAPRRPVPLRVHLRVWEHADTSFPLQPYVQAPELGLMTSGIPAGTLVVPVHPSQVGDRFLKQHYKIALISAITALFPYHWAEIPLRALKYSPNVTLSFVLLNQDASEGDYVRSWDIEGAIRDHFLPHLEPLKAIHNFSIESQLLYHAPLSFEPTYGQVPHDQMKGSLALAIEAAKAGDEDAEDIAAAVMDEEKEEAWLIDDEEMKVFVNSERWSLDSGSTNDPVLRFLLFVPSSKHAPMRLAVPDSAQSFLLPQFGAVTILNPPSTRTSSSISYHLPLETLESSFHLFTQHLYSLLALPPLPPSISTSPSLSPVQRPSDLVQPISYWQVNQILRMRTKENSDEARKTLAGIVRLVSKIKEMKVGEGVRGKVLGAVERLEQMDKMTTALEAFILSRDAVGLANQAFFDPSMMGLLYFPDEHKFAVYTPLFAPIAVPMIVGLLKEMLGWWRRRKGKKTSAEAKKVLQEDEILEGEETEKENKEEGELDQGEAAMTAASDASENGPQEVSVLRSRRIAANVDG